jgi:hypothetical protein
MVVDALNILEDFSITQLVVVDNGEYKGVYIYWHFKRRNTIMAKKNLNEMSFLDHLEDLRWLLVRSTIAIVIMALRIFF